MCVAVRCSPLWLSWHRQYHDVRSPCLFVTSSELERLRHDMEMINFTDFIYGVSPKIRYSRELGLWVTLGFVCYTGIVDLWNSGSESDLLISVPSLGVYYCQQLTLSVRLSHSFTFKLLLLFCFSTESSHFFGRLFSMWHSTKRCSSIFDLSPLTPKIYSPKFAQNRL